LLAGRSGGSCPHCILVWGAVQTKKALEDVAAGNFTERTWVLPCTDKRFCSASFMPRGSQTVLTRPFLASLGGLPLALDINQTSPSDSKS